MRKRSHKSTKNMDMLDQKRHINGQWIYEKEFELLKIKEIQAVSLILEKKVKE